jgi:predicted DCC family thiol-disulfide oxidoreductase YuxK
MTARTAIFFDGDCRLCSREIDTYRRARGAESLEFVDIADPHFDATRYGLERRRVRKHMHVRRADGSVAVGVEAFASIWDVLPGWRRLAKVIRLPGLNALARAGYVAFAEVRPYLPKRRREACTDDRCAI